MSTSRKRSSQISSKSPQIGDVGSLSYSFHTFIVKRASMNGPPKKILDRCRKMLILETGYAILESMTSNPELQFFNAFDQCFPMFLELGLFTENSRPQKTPFFAAFFSRKLLLHKLD